MTQTRWAAKRGTESMSEATSLPAAMTVWSGLTRAAAARPEASQDRAPSATRLRPRVYHARRAATLLAENGLCGDEDEATVGEVIQPAAVSEQARSGQSRPANERVPER